MNSKQADSDTSSSPPADTKQPPVFRADLPLIDDFLLSLKSNQYSLETVYNYERDLTVFAQFLAESHIPFDRLDKKMIAYYKAYLGSLDRKTAITGHPAGSQQLAATSMNRMLSALRTYLKYLIDMDYKAPIAPEAVKLVKTPKVHPKVPELSDLIRLIEAPSKLERDPRAGMRNRVMLELLFSTGMRISELVNLNRDQIDDSGRIFIRGKGKKERFVYLTPRAQTYVRMYLRERHDRLPALFIPYRGKGLKSAKQRISTNYFQERIKLYRRRLQITVPISAHTLRHGFATYLAEQGANPAAIQILLGHESLDTTTRYVHASDHYAEETHHTYHPLKDVR